MTTSSPKQNWNALYLRGARDIDDMDYADTFGIPAEMAYTQGLNDWMLDYVQTENEQTYIKDGMNDQEAKAKARYNRMNAENDLEDLYSLNNLK